MRPRDSQRKKVYDAERKAFAGAEVDLPEVVDVERYIHHVCGLGRVKESFPELAWRHITVGDGRRRRAAGGDGRGIYMPRWSRKRWIVLHELGHTIRRLVGQPDGPHLALANQESKIKGPRSRTARLSSPVHQI